MISSNFSEFLKNTPTKNPTNSPTKASAHFNNKRFCETKKKYIKSCKYCSVEITVKILDVTDLAIIEKLIILLSPFKKFTDLISGSSYVTSSIIIPGVSKLLDFLDSYKLKEQDIVSIAAKKMFVALKDRSKVYFKK
jgi:hypothetical protein